MNLSLSHFVDLFYLIKHVNNKFSDNFDFIDILDNYNDFLNNDILDQKMIFIIIKFYLK